MAYQKQKDYPTPRMGKADMPDPEPFETVVTYNEPTIFERGFVAPPISTPEQRYNGVEPRRQPDELPPMTTPEQRYNAVTRPRGPNELPAGSTPAQKYDGVAAGPDLGGSTPEQKYNA